MLSITANFIVMRPKRNFRKHIVFSCMCDFFYYATERTHIVFSCVCDFVFIRRKRIFPRILFSVVPVIFFLDVYLFVDTITLERLNQSKLNFHTRLLSEIARPDSKMGITGHM